MAQALPELESEHARPEVRSIGRSIFSMPAIPGRPAASSGAKVQCAFHSVSDMRGDWLHEPPPHRHGLLDPLCPAPRGHRGTHPRESRRLVKPDLGERHRFGDGTLLRCAGAWIWT